MKAIYIDPNNDPNYTKLAPYGFTHLFFDIREPKLNAAYFAGIRTHGYKVGVYAAWNWPETTEAFWPELRTVRLSTAFKLKVWETPFRGTDSRFRLKLSGWP